MDSAEVAIVAKKYLDSVYRVAINYSKNVQDAGDAVQNAFLKLIKTNLVFRDEEHIHRWLIRVTINECKSVWRTCSRHPISSLDELYDTGYELPTSSQNEYDTALRKQELWDAVMRMPAKYSIVLHLYYYEGYSVDEISKMVGISKSNVQIRLMRGRTMLKESLEEANYDGK